MAKFPFEVAVGFAPQVDESTYNTTLNGITTSWTTATGLVLGDPESGIGGSGLSLTLGRSRRDKAFLLGSFTRSLSDFLKAEVPTFEFAFPLCGNRNTAGVTPIDADATPIPGMDALLQGAGLVGAAWGSGIGWRYAFGSPNPISALIFINGMRIRLRSCRCSLSIEYSPGSIAVATATIEVGNVQGVSETAIPSTLDYTTQASVSAPVVESVAHAWQETRGFETLTLGIVPSFEDFADSNQSGGFVKEASDREVTISARMFSDDADKDFNWTQLTAASSAVLDQLSFRVGTAMADTLPIVAHQIVAPQPELLTFAPQPLGSKAGSEVEMILRGATANSELELIFD